jgi:hypothetical protein
VQVLAETPVLDVSGSSQIMTRSRKVNQFMTDKRIAVVSGEVILGDRELRN